MAWGILVVMERQAVQLATFGAGCFWCVEAVFEQLEGVTEVASGYMGGLLEHPSYEAVCTGSTGHAEVVQICFDPAVISYPTLLDWFFRSHDPTTLNRQGADSGTQYRSVIFHHGDQQRGEARAKIAELGEAGAFDTAIVTEVTAAGTFYPAEACHQDYYRLNRRAPYCQAVIAPKLAKLGLDDDGGGPRVAP
jgi:peptide-methionine (S)-S-oxide reductase